MGLTPTKLGRPDSCSDELWALLLRCWEKKPAARPSFERLVAALEVLKQGGNTSALMSVLENTPRPPARAPPAEATSSSPSTESSRALGPALVSSTSTPTTAGPAVPKRPRLDSRPSRAERPKPALPPTLADFPPNECEIAAANPRLRLHRRAVGRLAAAYARPG
jgi:hypothetical protein